MNHSDDLAYLSLSLVPGIGRARLQSLLREFETAEAVLEASYDQLLSRPKISKAAATAILETDTSAGERVARQMQELGGTILFPWNERFPRSLLEIPDVPTVLFALGRLELVQKAMVAIVGSRNHTPYGRETCRFFATGLSRAGLVVVSGMARGLDAAAHHATLDADGETVGVLGNGLGVVYPSANRELYERVARDGCLVTEFPPGEKPNAGSFPRRNRLISGLARVTLIVEARERSGALITAGCALTQGKDVLAIPGSITSPFSAGCNHLIQQGAKPALGLRDVLEEYDLTINDSPAARLPNDLSEDERKLLDILGQGCEDIDDVAAMFGGSAAHALAVMTSLEIRGIVAQEPGKRFRLTTPLLNA